jgi:GDP-L-fucose synthase
MNKILITGGNGLLGSPLVKNLNGDTFSSKECNLVTDSFKEFLTKKYEKEKPNTIIHCAAKVGGVGANLNNNVQFFNDNIKIDYNVLTSCLELDIDNLVTILSTCIFPDNVEYPLTSDKLDMGPPHHSNYGYAYAKRLLAYQTKIYRNVINKNWISIVPTNLYGPKDNFNLHDSHLVPALIRKAYESNLNGEDFVVWGDGSPLRQFVYSEDMSKIIEWSIDNWKKEKPLMAINEKEYSIKDIVNIITDRFNISQKKIKYNTNKPLGQLRKPAKSDVEWFDFTPIEIGINKTIDWFIENYNTNNIRL